MDNLEVGPVVQDLPRTPREYVSETAEDSAAAVDRFKVENSRSLVAIQVSRARRHFGAPVKFTDAPGGQDATLTVRPQKDPNFSQTQERMELDRGIQAVHKVVTSATQTTWWRPVNAAIQYRPEDFCHTEVQGRYEEVDGLAEFLTGVSTAVEEALQQNETVDIFKPEFANLGDEDATGFGSKNHSNIKEVRNFHDVAYTKGKRVEAVQWIPQEHNYLACSTVDNISFYDRVEHMGKATISHVLLWSWNESLAPHAILLSPWEVTAFKFWPWDRHFLIGGLSSGQLAIWKLSDYELGVSVGQKNARGATQADDDRKGHHQPEIRERMLSTIDDSHKRPVMALEWLPAKLEIAQRKGRTTEANPEDGPVKFLVSTAGDGQMLIWDVKSAIDNLTESDVPFKPLHKVQLQRQDSGTEMGCCQLLYAPAAPEQAEKPKEEGAKKQKKEERVHSCFWASTEEGELIFGDWAAKGEEDRKPEVIKRMSTVSKTFRPMLSLEKSPIFGDILLGVTDWSFFLWREGVEQHLFQSCYASAYFTCGCWSPTRPGVIFLGRLDGQLEVWDFLDQSHKPSFSHQVASGALTCLQFLKQEKRGHSEQRLAIGDEQGHLHVLVMPANLVKEQGKEKPYMLDFFDREERRVAYFAERRTRLEGLREEIEKHAQEADAAAPAEEGDDAALADMESQAMKAAEEAYQKLERQFREELGLTDN